MKRTICLLFVFSFLFFSCFSLFSCSGKEKDSAEPVTVTVTFQKNNLIAFENDKIVKKQLFAGGVYKTQTTTKGEYMSPPDDPTDVMAGVFLFGGWYKEPSCENSFDFNSEPINTDITLYAKWIKIDPVVSD